jgi:serine/threonine protein phosphatase 1
MANRTFAIGDLHGDLEALFKLLACFPSLDKDDTFVFVGDYIDRGPKSKQVLDYVRGLSSQIPCKIVTLRGNHEDAWLRVVERGWDEFILPPGNGCLATLRSYGDGPVPAEDEAPNPDELLLLRTGGFLPDEDVAWLQALPCWYEDEHAIYVHAGLPKQADGFPHPKDVDPQTALLWCREEAFFREYRGKLVVFGHTGTEFLPPELSGYTPDDPADLWAGECCIGIDTGAGKPGGFLTAVELPGKHVYESR